MSVEVELQACLRRREYDFKCMQIIYDLSKIVQQDSSKLSTFKARYKKIEQIRAAFMEASEHVTKLQLKLKPNSEIELGPMLSFDELYYASVEVAESLLATSASTSATDAAPSAHCRREDSIVQVKLPKLEIPRFDGKIENWQTFKDSYIPLIHDNSSLSDTERFHYLLSCLSGCALTLAKGVPITASNYPVVFNLLLDRYDNKRILANTYLEKIFKLTPINKPSLENLSELTNSLYESVNALRALKIDDLSEFILFHIASRSLDLETKKRFELQNTHEIPKFNDLIVYLQNYIKILEVSQPISVSTTPSNSSNNNKQFRNKGQQKSSSLVASTNQSNNNNNNSSGSVPCLCCNEHHSIYRCGKLHSMTLEQREQVVQKFKLCTNCLRPGHDSKNCKSKTTCFICNAKHNTLLHMENKSLLTCSVQSNENNECSAKGTSTLTCVTSQTSNTNNNCSTKILGSAVVRLRHADGSLQCARAVIDSGSMDSFITSACARRLGLRIRKCNLNVTGLGQSNVCDIKGYTFASIIPHSRESPKFDLPLVVLPKITSMMPSSTLPLHVKDHYKHLDLADRDFDRSGPIDLLLGVECFDQIYTGSRFNPGPGLPCALSSVFGWVISGQYFHNTPSNNLTCESVTSLLVSSSTIEDLVQRFWESEEPPKCKISGVEDEICEKMYKKGTYRTREGRYVVPLMLKEDAPFLGDSSHQAFNRFLSLERRLNNQTELKADYKEFMHQYEELGHMQLADSSTTNRYIIPHHCVVRPESSTTRLRVVFDASSRTTNNLSLNDIVHVGPKLQIDIVDLVTKFRLHKIVFTADICKMYRQILVRPEDRCYQHVLWRDEPNETLKEYELNTVTYGVSSSPYLAIRTLRQLAEDHGSEYSSRAGQVLCEDTFMDDVTTGCSSLDEAKQLKEDVTSLLSKGHFELRKWSTNTPELLSDVPPDHLQTSKSFDDVGNEFVKILGIRWNPSCDNFSYKFSDSFDVKFTKRSILSIVARIFDPLGWISPVVFSAKSLLQEMWRLNLGWDEAIPSHLAKVWHLIAANLSDLQNISLPRLIMPTNPLEIHLVGFCDGSLKGYGCCVYLCVVVDEVTTFTNLLIGKSRVAPLKPTTINRLELSAAVLLAQVMSHMYNLLKDKIHINSMKAYSDSTTTLSWLSTAPHLLKMYVANRVVQITDLISPEFWFHVSTEDNPADCCSRGVMCSDLIDHPLWWNGPSWLQMSPNKWPCKRTLLVNAELPELKPSVPCSLHVTESDNSLLTLTSRLSSLTKIQRTLAWCFRFISNSKVVSSNRNFSALSSSELETSMKRLVKFTQDHYMSSQVSQVKNQEQCDKSIQKLSPFLDEDGLLRVGGRIDEANLSPSALHPLLLPKLSPLSKLIVEHFHLKYLHCGPRTLQSLIQRRFWIIGLRLLIRTTLSKCVRCFKVKPVSSQPIMGKLPAARLQPSRCFQTTGIDFGGPFFLKESRRRGAKTYKAYMCLFVCLSSKAVHLEAVTELSSEAFLAALDRFVSRRGMCDTIISDCGTNFVGANKHLKEVFSELQKHHSEISDGLAIRQIKWKFNPPGAPHFGGIFESGIKSTKYHLKRVVGAQVLTLEEFITILAKVEAVLNSRPLCTLSPDPQESNILTPGHFLTGGPLVSLPEEPHRSRWPFLCLPILLAASACGSDILMVTMGGTKSHKMPFWELARGLIRRGHNITFISAFPADFHINGLEEIAPEGLVTYVRNYMSFDLVGARMRGEDQMPVKDILRYGYEACDAFLSDPETRSFLRSGRTFDLVILDGTYPECALGLVYKLKVPFMYINTVGFYTMPLSNSGSPAPYAVTPFFGKGFTDNMGIIDRALNAAFHLTILPAHAFSMWVLQGVLRRNFGPQMPHVYDMAKNVSFILQNGHYSVSYPRPYLPNVAEVACIHCKESKTLDPEIEEWISGAGETGFVYVSMGSSVRTTKMPLSAHRLLVEALGRLPQRVLWKQDAEQNMTDIPSNIRLYKWLPQQDLLGHPKIKAFVTHGGLLSMFETVYHGVPIVTIPIFCDHDANAAKAEIDGYAKKLELQYLTPEKLYKAILEVITEPRYKIEVKKRQILLRDQKETPLERAIYWTEYVIRHKGAYHLQSPAKDMSFFQYYSIDVFLLIISVLVTIYALISYALRLGFNRLINNVQKKEMHKLLGKSNNLLTESKLLRQGTIAKKKIQ